MLSPDDRAAMLISCPFWLLIFKLGLTLTTRLSRSQISCSSLCALFKPSATACLMTLFHFPCTTLLRQECSQLYTTAFKRSLHWHSLAHSHTSRGSLRLL